MRYFMVFGILMAGLTSACAQPHKDAQILQEDKHVRDMETPPSAHIDNPPQHAHIPIMPHRRTAQDNKLKPVTMPAKQNSPRPEATQYWVKDMTADIYTQGKVKIGSLKFQDQVAVYQENDGWVKIDPVSDKWMRMYNLVARRPHTPLRPMTGQTRSGIGWVDPAILKAKPD